MKAQISLEFMVAVAIYLAFLSVLIYSQGNIIQDLKNNAEVIGHSLNADSSNFIFSLGRIYSSKLGSAAHDLGTHCNVFNGTVYCGQENAIEKKLYVNDSYEKFTR